jgi:hypothetical protein
VDGGRLLGCSCAQIGANFGVGVAVGPEAVGEDTGAGVSVMAAVGVAVFEAGKKGKLQPVAIPIKIRLGRMPGCKYLFMSRSPC